MACKTMAILVLELVSSIQAHLSESPSNVDIVASAQD